MEPRSHPSPGQPAVPPGGATESMAAPGLAPEAEGGCPWGLSRSGIAACQAGRGWQLRNSIRGSCNAGWRQAIRRTMDLDGPTQANSIGLLSGVDQLAGGWG